MRQFVTLLRGAERSSTPSARPLTLPPDLLQKVRSRVQLVAVLLVIGFVVDPAIQLGLALASLITDRPTDGFVADLLPLAANLAAILLSMAVWKVARSSRVSQSLLVDIGLIYEVVICLVVALDTHHHFLTQGGELPHVTWVVPIIILFPLILPSPPRRMLLAAIAAALCSPLSLLLLDLGGGFDLRVPEYVHATLNPALAVVLAYFASRVVYGLNVDVARAREMGSYRLVELLGRGGMGEVWRAEHRMLARTAAIKLIPPGSLAAGAAERPEIALLRFEKEAQATASLRSPHTIDLYDFGQADDGSLYYVMELLDGVDLEALVEQHGPLPAERVVHFLRQICHSLAEAHAAGLIHRDIKPANVFVCRYGLEADFVKVMDFGLVKSREEDEQQDPRLTAENVAGGTPAFMAPEQILSRDELDGRADLYALGCVAHWLLTGKLVFEGSSALEILTHHVHTEPAAASTQTDLSVPLELDELILRCLAKSPEDRPPDASHLDDELAAIAAAHPWTGEQSLSWWESQRPRESR